MCMGAFSPSAPSAPVAPVAPPAAPEAARAPETPIERGDTSDSRRRRAASGTGSRSTILTSSRGVQNDGAVATKTLLGQ